MLLQQRLIESDPGIRTQQRLQQAIAQTASDREYILRYQNLSETDQQNSLSYFANMLVDLAETDSDIVYQRIEHLYASFSVNIEAYDSSCSLSTQQTDQFVSAVICHASANSDIARVPSITETIVKARHNGLNPAKTSLRVVDFLSQQG